MEDYALDPGVEHYLFYRYQWANAPLRSTCLAFTQENISLC